MAISMLRHPFGAGQVGIKSTFRAIRLKLGIDVQHYLGHLAPVRTLGVCIKHTQISDHMLLIVDRQHGIRWCDIVNVWISWWLFHERIIKRTIQGSN